MPQGMKLCDQSATRPLQAAGIGLALLFWPLAAAVDSFVFGDAPFSRSLLQPGPAQLWMRSLVVLLLAGISWYAARLRSRYLEAERASRSKSEFLASVSHEIRTPMTAILGYVDEMIDAGDLRRIPADRLRALDTIRRNGLHLLQVINDILDLTKLDAGRLELECVPCSPRVLVSEVCSLMRVRATEKGLELETSSADTLPECVRADPTRVRQVLLNLVSNAIKFTEQGAISISADTVGEGAQAQLRLRVKDPGIGMSEEQVARLFEPFTQGDRSTTRLYGGTGLGLSISLNLVEHMGGAIEVESAPDEGTCFSVTLPLEVTDEDVGETDARLDAYAAWLKRNQQPPPRLSCRVLLAEDGADNQRLIRSILERVGARVEVVGNGRLALERALAARDDGEPFDLILMDMHMPVLDGYNATRALRRAGYDLPVIALTAHAMSDDRDRCLQAGCDDYVAKPIDRPQFFAAIARVTYDGKSDEAGA